jgi:hypothetical protein
MSRIYRSVKFQLCLTQTEKELLEQRAKEAGLTLSEYFRTAALKQKMPQKIPTINIETYRELGKIGSNLNQITKAINTAIKLGITPPKVELTTLNKLEALVNLVRQEIAGSK